VAAYKKLYLLHTPNYINFIINNRKLIKANCGGKINLHCITNLENKNILKHRDNEISDLHDIEQRKKSNSLVYIAKNNKLDNQIKKINTYDLQSLKDSNNNLLKEHNEQSKITRFLKREMKN
jgi:hypothetical protein